MKFGKETTNIYKPNKTKIKRIIKHKNCYYKYQKKATKSNLYLDYLMSLKTNKYEKNIFHEKVFQMIFNKIKKKNFTRNSLSQFLVYLY